MLIKRPLSGLFLVLLLCAEASGQQQGLQVVFPFGPDLPPGNVTITPSGRMFMSLHQFYGSNDRVVEVLEEGVTAPFPDEVWSREPKGESPIGLYNVLGLRADEHGIVWLLDQGPKKGAFARIVGWDVRAKQLKRVVELSAPALVRGSRLNDLAVDTKHNALFITDPAAGANAALIAVDLASGRARRLLQGHVSTRPENEPLVINGRSVTRKGRPVLVGADGITIDTAFEWVYFAPMSGRSLYRARAADLLDEGLTAESLSARVQRFGDKPICDGITIDGAGNIYITDITNNAIGVVSPEGKYRVLFKDDRKLLWPDGMSFAPDGYVYATVNQLNLSPALNNGRNASNPPFFIVRFRPLAKGAVGR